MRIILLTVILLSLAGCGACSCPTKSDLLRPTWLPQEFEVRGLKIPDEDNGRGSYQFILDYVKEGSNIGVRSGSSPIG